MKCGHAKPTSKDCTRIMLHFKHEHPSSKVLLPKRSGAIKYGSITPVPLECVPGANGLCVCRGPCLPSKLHLCSQSC